MGTIQRLFVAPDKPQSLSKIRLFAIHTQCAGTTSTTPSIPHVSTIYIILYIPSLDPDPHHHQSHNQGQRISSHHSLQQFHFPTPIQLDPPTPAATDTPKMCFQTTKTYNCGHSTTSLAVAYGHAQPCASTGQCVVNESGPCPACMAKAVAWAQARSAEDMKNGR